MKNRILFLIALFAVSATARCAGQVSEEEFFEAKTVQLNDSLTLTIRQVTQEYYEARKKASAHLRPRTYEVITDFEKARKWFDDRLKIVEPGDNGYEKALEITFSDGAKRRLDFAGQTLKSAFIRYYPELDILVLPNEADGDEIIALSDSSPESSVGDPDNYLPSPDSTLRISGYYPGGAADTEDWFIEKWDDAKKKYRILAFWEGRDMSEYHYAEGWFWADNATVLFTTGRYYYEMNLNTMSNNPFAIIFLQEGENSAVRMGDLVVGPGKLFIHSEYFDVQLQLTVTDGGETRSVLLRSYETRHQGVVNNYPQAVGRHVYSLDIAGREAALGIGELEFDKAYVFEPKQSVTLGSLRILFQWVGHEHPINPDGTGGAPIGLYSFVLSDGDEEEEWGFSSRAVEDANNTLTKTWRGYRISCTEIMGGITLKVSRVE